MINEPQYGEPWSRGELEPDCVVYRNWQVAHRSGSKPEFTPKELDRIIACVNACAGVPTEQLTEFAVLRGWKVGYDCRLGVSAL